MTQMGFYFDESRCLDCRSCSVACQDWNDIHIGTEKYLRKFTWEEGLFPETKMHFVFAPCYHCEDAACVKACPNGAISKDEKTGAVLVDEAKCKGCKKCWDACPYGAPRFSVSTGVMKKCTMCADRLEEGKLPVCVETCITRALDFGPIDELKAKYGENQQLAGMPEPATKPAIVFKEAEAKTPVVPYDADKARELFGFDAAAFAAAEDGVRKTKLDMKIADPREELDVLRSDEC